ncbi:MAG: HEPN domain-containing protein [bacterium]
MDIREHIEYWINGANDDIEVAKSLFNSGYYLWSLFIGHLVLEKILKALFVANTKSIEVPRSHNLLYIAELSGLELDLVRKDLYFKINDFNIEARYPDKKSKLYSIVDKEFANNYLEKIEENVQWIKSMLKY